MKLLSRILGIMLENHTIVKTKLSQEANINYTRLVKHLDWLEQKNFIEFTVNDGKVNLVLTKNGREFTKALNPI